MHLDKKKYIEYILGGITKNLEKNPKLFGNFLKSFEIFIENIPHLENKLKNCPYFFSGNEENPGCQYGKCPYKTSDKGCYFMEFLKPVISEYFLENQGQLPLLLQRYI